MGENLSVLRSRIVTGALQKLSHMNPHAHDFEMVLEKGLVKDREARYQFAGDVAADLTCTSSEAVLT
jgi:hypothetical protein